MRRGLWRVRDLSNTYPVISRHQRRDEPALDHRPVVNAPIVPRRSETPPPLHPSHCPRLSPGIVERTRQTNHVSNTPSLKCTTTSLPHFPVPSLPSAVLPVQPPAASSAPGRHARLPPHRARAIPSLQPSTFVRIHLRHPRRPAARRKSIRPLLTQPWSAPESSRRSASHGVTAVASTAGGPTSSGVGSPDVDTSCL